LKKQNTILTTFKKNIASLEAKAYAFQAIQFHHQALGNPLERIEKLASRLAEQKVKAMFSRQRAKQLATELLEAVEALKQKPSTPTDTLETI